MVPGMNEQQRLTQNIRAVVAAYRACRRPRLAISTVSRLFFNDGKLLGRILGRNPPPFLVTSYDAAMLKFSEAWPVGAAWPPAVDRPPPRRRAA
jgi:hypothetical protein